MALSSRPRPFRDSSLFVIGLEGEESGAEYQYFQEILTLLDLRRVRLEFLPTSEVGHDSDPDAVFNRVQDYTETHRLERFDRVWIILDFDSWGDKKLSLVAMNAKQCDFSLGISNPCFELWLLLHHEHVDLTSITNEGPRGRSRAAKSAWRARTVSITHETVIRARTEARRLGAGDPASARWPSCPGSDIYRLFDDLEDKKALGSQGLMSKSNSVASADTSTRSRA